MVFSINYEQINNTLGLCSLTVISILAPNDQINEAIEK